MPRKKKTMLDHAADAASRYSLSTGRKRKYLVYARSVSSRLLEVDFSLYEIKELYSKGEEDTSTLLPLKKKMIFRCSVFASMAYSVFDILANAANAIHSVYSDERKVSFKGMALDPWRGKPVLRKEVIRITGRQYFKRLDAMRNCVLHRRSLYLERRTIEPPEAFSDDTTDTGQKTYEWVLADDHSELSTATTLHRELLKELEQCRKFLAQDVTLILKSI